MCESLPLRLKLLRHLNEPRSEKLPYVFSPINQRGCKLFFAVSCTFSMCRRNVLHLVFGVSPLPVDSPRPGDSSQGWLRLYRVVWPTLRPHRHAAETSRVDPKQHTHSQQLRAGLRRHQEGEGAFIRIHARKKCLFSVALSDSILTLKQVIFI